MVNSTKSKTDFCDECKVRIPKNRPKLYCSNCEQPKHFRCQKLTKNDAQHIIDLQILWTCVNCLLSALPVNACNIVRNNKTSSQTNLKFKVKCASCSGWSYSPRNVKNCSWCDGFVHLKCFRNQLGCVKCCNENIPGYNVTSYEINMDYCDRLNNLIFNPYNQAHFSNQIGNAFENEEHESSYWNGVSEILINCKYKQQKNVHISKNNELKIFSLNVQSLGNKVEHFREEIDTYNKYDVLCLSETNINLKNLPNGLNDLALNGFHEPFVQDPMRTSGKGGGLVTFINKRVCDFEKIEPFDPKDDPSDSSGEVQFFKIHNCKGFNRTKIIGNIYRSPSRSPGNFVNLFDSVCRNLNRHSRKQITLTGDLNIDLLKHENFEAAQNLIEVASKYGFMQLVSRPTRITENSCTLIDHVYCNDIHNTLSCNILTVGISDHLATLMTVSLGNARFGNERSVVMNPLVEDEQKAFRIFNEANNLKFNELIEEEKWEAIFDVQDANAQYNKFCEIYTKNYETAYPLKRNRIRRKNERKNPKPWILPWLEDACSRKQDLYHKSVQFPTKENIQAYKKMDKFCEKHRKIAQKKYYQKYFNTYKNCSKKQWNMINNLLNRKPKCNSVIKLKDINGNLISSNKEVASKFNEYFSGIASSMKDKTGARMTFDPGGFKKFLGSPCQNSIALQTVDSGEIHDIIKKLKNKSTLDTKIEPLKIANKSFAFTEALANVVNSSFEQGIFPQALKSARVVPIHKEGPKTDVTNYRPISLLGAFSKIYEKLMHNRVMEFLNKNNLLFEMQYGFRPGRSCEHALLNAQNQILDSLSKKQISLLLLIDFSKAFDIVEHPILLHKLKHYGIRGIALKWFESYLSDRQQFVTINGADSSAQNMAYGVPQGSILGPLLFIIYINDLPNISEVSKFILYADDANILVNGSNVHEVMQKINKLCQDLVQWVDLNGLALNLKKTKFMIFARQRLDLSKVNLQLRNHEIERKTECRFLGVIVDDKLNWSYHIAAIRMKMAKYLGIMFKIKHRLPQNVRLQIFHSFVQSHLNYCPLVWGFSAKSHIESLFTKQKQGIRAVMSGYVNYWYKEGKLPARTKEAFKELNILTVHSIIALQTLMFMHKVSHFPKSLPTAICSTIPSNIPKFETTYDDCIEWSNKYNNIPFRSSIFCKGPMLSLCNNNAEITTPSTLSSLSLYKTYAKKMLLSQQSSGTDEDWPVFLIYNIPGLRKSNRTL